MAESPRLSPLKDVLALSAALVLCGQWLVFHTLGWNLAEPWRPLLPGIAIFGAAFLLSWGAELAQTEIPQALALAFVALVAVLPEYAVDMYFAWTAGKDPTYIAYAAANMTGGNRLLIGAGWTVVVLAFWFKTKQKEIVIESGHRLELLALIVATLYSFILPLKGSISWVDSVILIAMFGLYMTLAAHSGFSEPELEEGPAAWLAQNPRPKRIAWAIGLFVFAGIGIYTAAHPFAEGLLESGRHWGIEEFLLVQWLAPLASESPEFLVAILFALRGKPDAGIGTLLSSTVNQWTLLVGMLPLAYGISGGHFNPMALDTRQSEEFLLTSSQSLFATLILCDLRFSLRDGVVILALFLLQFVFIHPAARYIYSGAYLALAVGLFLTRSSYRTGLSAAFKDGLNRLRPSA